MPYFLCRLNAPRPNFAFEMTDDERAVMQTHAGYWRELVAKGSAVLFGPVMDPKGPWGLGILEAADETAARALSDADPVMKADRGFSTDIMPVHIPVIRGAAP
jgi:uncharacterized protein YciI